ncbi:MULTISPECIES: cation transporter [unclassified Streptomyces]|uniref:cation transporter n=1 Tax=unclassified Streptomyces TaxID=2593676 RepID=UPI0037FEC0A5
MTAISLGPSPARRDALARRIRLLVAATITCNVVEAVVAITAGTIASSTALAAYVSADAVRALAGTGEADRSLPGIVIAALSLAIIPFLSAAQRKAGRELGSASAVADSRQTLLCTHLSAVLLVGLILNATLGWSWADPVAALVIAAVAVKEGRDAWQGKGCCAPTAHAPAGVSGALAEVRHWSTRSGRRWRKH